VRLLLTMLAMVLLLSPVASRQLTVIRVAKGDNLQAAIEAARPGDIVLLAAGARFSGNFVLPAHAADAQAFITIRTDSDALPPAGARISPHASGTLAVLQSDNGDPALRTAPGAHHWRLENLEFGPSRAGNGAIIEFGASAQRRDQVPHDLVLDRVYVHGDPATGQKRAIALNSAATEIRNSYLSDIKGVGLDTQAIAGWNGPGPYVIENNYIEAAGENILFGGADPSIPDLVPTDILIRRNHITRPRSWREPIVATPQMVAAQASTTGGSLAAGTYAYRVVAERPVTGGATAISDLSPPAAATVSSEASAAISWPVVPGASAYRVLRTDAAGATRWWRVTEPRFIDTGADSGTAGDIPASTTWSVKNLLELKNASGVTIDANLFEYHWAGAQAGYAIVLTPRNQDGRAPWSRVDRVRFTNNLVRHVAGVFNVLGTDNLHPSGPARDILIENNLFVDVNGRAWGGQGDFLQMGDGVRDVRVERNTIDHSGRIVSAYGQPSPGFVFRANVVRHNTYGVMGAAASPGTLTFERFLPGAIFEGNVLAGGEKAKYPSGNTFISAEAFEREFENAAAGDFRWRKGAGTGADVTRIEAAVGSR
jgi:hypothetical protein